MGAADEDEGTQGPSGEEKIFVSVRLRPLNDKETARNDVYDWECINDNTVIYRNNLSVSERSMYPTAYVFDRVFRPDCTTRQVYEEGAKEVALAVVRGINSSVFAYGQTSSGKTYTMSGITEYTVADIYDHIEKHKEREYILKFSAMEIYNESVRDLLSMDTTPLRLLDDPERGTVVERLTEETLRDWNHFKELLSICEAQRQIGETSMNETSSRSHQILRLTIESSAREFLGNDKSSSLSASVNFVDLAGSERASQASSAGMRLKEGCHINRSLLTLGTVIRKLSKGRNGHIPFRDSKLTRILQSSLGGNARTAIICTISPARSHVEQSRNTLVFASCAKEVMTNARVNVVVSDKALVKQLQRELARLESELRSAGSNPVTSDSAEILREKDLQIEKLMREVVELNQQLELSQSQVENFLRMAEDDRSSTLSGDPDHQYPKLRVRSSFRSLNSYPYSPASEDPPSVHIGVRSFDASQCSAGDNSSSISDENFINLTDFQDRFVRTNSTLELSNGDATAENDQDMKDGKVENLVSFGNICKEVQCITDADSTTNSQILENSPLRYADSNVSSVSSPNINTGASTLTQVETDDREHQDLPSEEQKDLNCVHSDFVTPVPEKPTSWLLSEQMHRSRSLKMNRSRSCGSIITVVSPCLSERIANSATTPMMGFQKDFTKRSEASQGKLAELENSPNVEQLLRNVSSASVGSAAVDDSQLQSIDASIDWKSTPSVINSDAGMKYMMDYLEQETTPDANECRKSVKDIGLDPIQDDSDTATKWPSDFKRLQMEIIELWHACSVSLIHRTYFFLLFKGDPADSFYMEVEIRKLNFLKDTFSKGDETMVDGRRLSLASSERAVNQERQMLCKRMQKQLSREEKENLFLKWGIPLASSNRRMQLTNRLWAKTTDMDHIIESATLIAKLIGFDGQEQTLKQMFGLLNFTPQHPSKRKSSVWIRSILSLL